MFALPMPLNRLLCARWTLVCIALLLCLTSFALPANGQFLDLTDKEIDINPLKAPSTKTNRSNCKVEENSALFSIMDKVCELCHDMYSHSNPNMMNQCRSKCYRSAHFKKCLHLFSPTRSLRHVLRRH